MGVTFHRAFDRCNDLFKGLEEVIRCGCERILTSGASESALAGAEVIRDLIGRAAGRIVVMPGAGLTPENMAEVARETGAHEFHGTFRSPFAGDMCYLNESLGDEAEENTHWLCDAAKLGKLFQTDATE